MLTESEDIGVNNLVELIKLDCNPITNIEEIVDKIPDEVEFVLLGECTHGTKEFYEIRSEMTKLLVKKKNFKVVLVEGNWPEFYRVNKYITTKNPKDKTSYESLRSIKEFPLWMWKNNVIADLIDWLREYNSNYWDTPNNPELVRMLGMDCYSLYESKRWLLAFLKIVDIEYHQTVINSLRFLDRYKTVKEYAHDVVHGRLKNCLSNIQFVLQNILSKIQWEKTDKYIELCEKKKIDKFAAISAEQCCEVIISADEYYRKLYSEPSGSNASWNCRDQHMLMTVMRLTGLLPKINNNEEPVKIVIWAHNSHLGDSTATNRGGLEFNRNESWNLGQMIRSMYGREKTKLYGFYTYDGTVTAADNWGDPCKKYQLTPSLPYSYEWFFHKVAQQMSINSFHLNMNKYEIIESDTDTDTETDVTEYEFAELPNTYRFLHNLNKITETHEMNSTVLFENININSTFVAVERRVVNNGIIRLRMENGGWVTEYVAYGSITKYCIPVNSSIVKTTEELFSTYNLQRWIGVNYKKETEISSHYGESMLSKQFDNIIFIDNTSAL